MTRIKGQLTTADYLPYKEFLRLLDALDRDGEYLGETYCWLSFCTAFRASDVRTLKWKDVLGKKELVAENTKEPQGEIQCRCCGKDGRAL